MVNLDAMRPSGRTYVLSLTTAASSALQIVPTTNDQTNYVCLMATGTDVCAVELAPESTNLLTPAIASTGNGGSFVVLPNMRIVIAAPKGPFYIQAISGGTNTLYITPLQAD